MGQSYGTVIIEYNNNFSFYFFSVFISFQSIKLANLVASEFFNQGDLEKEKFKQEPIVCISFLKYKCNFSFQIN